VSRAGEQQVRVFLKCLSGNLFVDTTLVSIVSASMTHFPVHTNKKDTGETTTSRPVWDRNTVFYFIKALPDMWELTNL